MKRARSLASLDPAFERLRIHLKIDDGFSSIYMDTWPLMQWTPAGYLGGPLTASMGSPSLNTVHFRLNFRFASSPKAEDSCTFRGRFHQKKAKYAYQEYQLYFGYFRRCPIRFFLLLLGKICRITNSKAPRDKAI